MSDGASALAEQRSSPRLLVVGARWPLETFLDNLLRGLARKGWEVSLASRSRFDRQDAGATKDQVALRRLPLPGDGPGALLSFLPRFTAILLSRPRQVLGLLRGQGGKAHLLRNLLPLLARDFDAFYFPWNGTAIDYLPLFGLGTPTLLSCRGSHVLVAPHNPERQHLRASMPPLFAAATAVHGVSRDILRAAERLGLDSSKAEVIHPAVDTDFFAPPKAKPVAPPAGSEVLRLIGTGSLIWPKGFEYALRALAELHRRGRKAHLTLIGEGQDRQRLLFAAFDLGLEEAVALVGRKSPAEVRDLLQASDIFLLPSLSEGISNAALEAMACGLPVVASDCGGMSEAIEDGIDGLLLPPRDPHAIADAVEKLADDESLRCRLGRAARERVLREFGIEGQITAFDHSLRRLLEPKAP